MKVYKILFLICMVFFVIGAASAEDNVTVDEPLTVNQTEPVIEESAAQDEIIEDINVTFEEQMWKENLSDISVELPENASGEFSVKINEEVIYNETITNKSFKVPVRLPQKGIEMEISIYPPLDSKSYKVSAFYNGIDLNINKTLKVMKFSPDYNYFGFPEEILQYGDNYNMRYMLYLPRSANGFLEVYVDENRILNKSRVTGPYFDLDYSKISRLALGNHTIRFVYSNDTYYHDVNRTFNFTVVNAVISIPKTVNMGHDTCVSVDVLKNVTAVVKVYIDGVLIDTQSTTGSDYILSLEDYLKYNSSEVRVEVTSKSFSRTKVQHIGIIYDFEIYSGIDFIYGEENVIEIYLPDNLNTKILTVTVDGVKYKFTHPANIMNNVAAVDVSKLGVGNHTLFISYPGDEGFVAKNKTVNFTVRYEAIYPWLAEFNDNSEVVLKLPADAKGLLKLYVDGKFFKSAKFTKGVAKIKISGISEGWHDLNATYTGDDYSVTDQTATVEVTMKVSIAYRFTQGEDKYVSVKVAKNSKGYVIFYINGNPHKVYIKNGIAKYSLKYLKPGEYDVDIRYERNDGYSDFVWRVITVYKPKVKIISAKLYPNAVYAKLKVSNHNNKVIKNAKVTVKVNGKKYTVKTNAKGIAVLYGKANLKIKKYKLTASYKAAKASKTVKVQNIRLLLKSVKIRKSAKKVVLTATLKKAKKPVKSKTVSFKFNGKTYKAKTDKKGIAKVNVRVKGVKVGDTVSYQAKYLTNAVIKSAIVSK